jgi:hypothetical protein
VLGTEALLEEATRPRLALATGDPTQGKEAPANPNASPDAPTASMPHPTAFPDVPRRHVGKVDWKNTPEPVKTCLFEHFKMSEISRCLGITYGTVCCQKSNWEASRSRATAPANPIVTPDAPLPPDATPSSPPNLPPFPELLRRSDGTVAWKKVPEGVKTYLFTTFTVRQISSRLGITYEAVGHQKNIWERSRSPGAAKPDGPGDVASAPPESKAFAADLQPPSQDVTAVPAQVLPQ